MLEGIILVQPKKLTWIIGGSTVCFSFLGISQFVPVITANSILTCSQMS